MNLMMLSDIVLGVLLKQLGNSHLSSHDKYSLATPYPDLFPSFHAQIGGEKTRVVSAACIQ